MRTILVHLNVEVPDDDPRDANAIADAILSMIEVGSDDDSVREFRVFTQPFTVKVGETTIVCPMAEEI